MKSQRRLGAESAKNRKLLIDTAEQLLVGEGYGAITAKKVATAAGLKEPLVYYYFETMDELIREVIRKSSAKRMKRFVRALTTPEPLQSLWSLNRDHTNAISATELIALANHREAIRAEAVASAQEFRALQIEAVDRLLEARGVDRDHYPAGAIVTILAALARAMAQDSVLGVTEGYAEAMAVVERMLATLGGGDVTKPGSASADAYTPTVDAAPDTGQMLSSDSASGWTGEMSDA